MNLPTVDEHGISCFNDDLMSSSQIYLSIKFAREKNATTQCLSQDLHFFFQKRSY